MAKRKFEQNPLLQEADAQIPELGRGVEKQVTSPITAAIPAVMAAGDATGGVPLSAVMSPILQVIGAMIPQDSPLAPIGAVARAGIGPMEDETGSAFERNVSSLLQKNPYADTSSLPSYGLSSQQRGEIVNRIRGQGFAVAQEQRAQAGELRAQGAEKRNITTFNQNTEIYNRRISSMDREDRLRLPDDQAIELRDAQFDVEIATAKARIEQGKFQLKEWEAKTQNSEEYIEWDRMLTKYNALNAQKNYLSADRVDQNFAKSELLQEKSVYEGARNIFKQIVPGGTYYNALQADVGSMPELLGRRFKTEGMFSSPVVIGESDINSLLDQYNKGATEFTVQGKTVSSPMLGKQLALFAQYKKSSDEAMAQLDDMYTQMGLTNTLQVGDQQVTVSPFLRKDSKNKWVMRSPEENAAINTLSRDQGLTKAEAAYQYDKVTGTITSPTVANPGTQQNPISSSGLIDAVRVAPIGSIMWVKKKDNTVVQMKVESTTDAQGRPGKTVKLVGSTNGN